MAQSDLRNLKSRSVAGAVAGNVACVGVKKGDRILVVQNQLAAGVNFAAEFTATADDVINNTGGTSTAALVLLVLWVAKNPRG